MAGLDVNRFLTSDDPVELGLMRRIANRVTQLREYEMDELAKRIRNQVVEGFGG
jgi:hypothetical protein